MPAWKDTFRQRLLGFCMPFSSPRSDSEMESERSNHDLHIDGHGTFNMQAKATQRLPLPPEWIEKFAQLSDVEALHAFHKQFPDELARLKKAPGTMESSKSSTIGMDPSEGNPHGLTPSKLIYPDDDKDYVEVNRTCVSMLCLKWIWNQEYDKFTGHQKPERRLSQESFDTLCAHVREILGPAPGHTAKLTALLVAVVIGDIGKDPGLEQEVVDFLKEKNTAKESDLSWIDKMNHDEVVYQAAANDMLTATRLLRGDLQKDVILGLKIGSKINVPQLAQAENVPGSLVYLDHLKGKDQAFRLKYLEVILDVAGAQGHVDSRGAVNLIEGVYQGFASCRNALESIIAGTRTFRDGYDQVLRQRAKLLDSKGIRLLRTDVPSERAVLRLMCMARVDNNADAADMLSAFDGLRNTTRQRLVDGLSVDGYQDGEAILMYYIPAVFVKTYERVRSSPVGKRIEALKSVMRFMVKGYNGSKPEHNKAGSITELYIGAATHTISEDTFAADPSVLDRLDPYVLDREEREKRRRLAEEEKLAKQEGLLRAKVT